MTANTYVSFFLRQRQGYIVTETSSYTNCQPQILCLKPLRGNKNGPAKNIAK